MSGPALWTSEAADQATGGRSNVAWRASGVSIDSRRVANGDLFVALQGPNLDGHDFVLGALRGGAAAAVISHPPAGVGADCPYLEVADTFAALNDLGRAARARTAARLIAITGSVGKTGVKEALRAALGPQGRTYATEGNLNNHWGVPLSLARMPAETEFGVFELGMNHSGELTPLSLLVRPHIAIITAIAAAHVEFFDSLEQVARAKAEIFAGVDGGVAVLNRDDEWFALLADAARAAGLERIVGFGADPQAEARLLDCTLSAQHSDVTADIGGRRVTYRIGAPGRHWVTNSLAVLAAADAAGADIEAAGGALAGLAPPAGRGARHRVPWGGGEIEVIDDSYNASPAAMRAAFETLALGRPGEGGRRIAVLGDMLELGAESPALHAALAGPLSDNGIDLVLSAGPDMAHLDKALPAAMRGAHAADSAKLLPAVLDTVAPGDLVCVKGSLGSRMGLIVDALLDKARAA